MATCTAVLDAVLDEKGHGTPCQRPTAGHRVHYTDAWGPRIRWDDEGNIRSGQLVAS